MKEKLSSFLSDFSLVVVVCLAVLIGYWHYSTEPEPEIPPIDPEKEIATFHSAIFANCRNVDFKNLEEVIIACCPVPQPAIKISGEFSNTVFFT